ncbi:hypothetical protein IFM89_028038 [Coptis chinensis]|uniref:Uncharacterized protein n=1 Tax=Coptis chinensis TaxID=261450 RepID=A0A835HG73_9MAGN|nr:hypothetical protein IFM89_028038 [Coptis chinensis]
MKMEKARHAMELTQEETETVSGLKVSQHEPGYEKSFYEKFALKGIRVDRVEPGCVVCSFKVPSRLTNTDGNFSSGAIANLIDEVGGAVVHIEGLPRNVSVDMSISFLSTAKIYVR